MRDDPARASEPGSGRGPRPAYVLLLDLVRKYRNNRRDRPGVTFGAGQAAVCRYVRVADRTLAAMPPAPRRFVDVLRGVGTPEEFAAPFPGGAKADAMLVDGTHVRFVGAGDGDVRDATYPGKKRAHAGNAVAMAAPDGMTIAIGRTYRGSMHDIAITREFLGDLGAFADKVSGADLPEGTRGMAPRVLADSGFRGPERDLPGAGAVTPVKRPRGGRPTKRQKEHNGKLSRERATAESAIASTGHYGRASSTYGGTSGDLNSEFDVACGLANARPMLRGGTYDHWQSVLSGGPGGR